VATNSFYGNAIVRSRNRNRDDCSAGQRSYSVKNLGDALGGHQWTRVVRNDHARYEARSLKSAEGKTESLGGFPFQAELRQPSHQSDNPPSLAKRRVALQAHCKSLFFSPVTASHNSEVICP
jgi:hypothetical protein